MKIFAALIFLFITTSSPASDISKPAFTLTSDCVVSVEITKDDYANRFTIAIITKDSEGEWIKEFSELNILKVVELYDGKGTHLISQTVLHPFSSRIQISVESQELAGMIKQSIQSSIGNCGMYISND